MKTRIIYIIGKGRSGSTFLGDFLGSLPGVFHAGELNNLWKYGISAGNSCSCGESLTQCPVWASTMRTALADERCAWAFREPHRMLNLQRDWLSFRGHILSKVTLKDPTKYLNTMDGIYAAIHKATGKNIIVDSSKWPLEPRLTDASRNDNVDVIHLTRNPWAVSDSWQSFKKMPDTGGWMPRFSRVHSSLSWNARVMAAERIRRHLGSAGHTLQFEKVIQEPEETLVRLSRMLNLRGAESIVNHRTVSFDQSHAVFGNPSRFQSGSVQVKQASLDENNEHLLVTLLTWPGRKLAGY